MKEVAVEDSFDAAESRDEIVVGLVGPVGGDFDKLGRSLHRCLEHYRYRLRDHRLSNFFDLPEVQAVAGMVSKTSESERIGTSMDVGDKLRSETKLDNILALYAAADISQKRAKSDDGEPLPASRTAHILRSLKRPEEVSSLRQIYGSRFVVISAYVPRQQRIANLSRKMDEKSAVALIGRDEEGGDHGQATSRTFELADLFVDGTLGEEQLVTELHRFFDLYFGCPFVTPRQEEHAMFLAFASSLRSGDLSRQVGAVVTTTDGTLLGEGANDAPRFGGGQYWPGESDQRDIVLGYDSNEAAKRVMAERILTAFNETIPEGADPIACVKRRLSASGLLDITEFGRAVHAEMAAILSCARSGVSTKGGVLFCTTFPCHNCAKHIVAAGITSVRFIEPYAKSRAVDLHGDAIALDDIRDRVTFTPFLGIGPRRYVDLFVLRDGVGNPIRRKAADGSLTPWSRGSCSPKISDDVTTYLEREDFAFHTIESTMRSDP